ncbi:probable glutathione S-transferase [Selaginella moellendorffii]|uniref:probable glutathione S-transferase n=1 Tax=Selaginella moellendorffii TaxID=88036 RepID=UPI000D1CE705|nr:probable glutathione S-transferase [Selaginella moellendorffii]|eukprot:XP_024526896.1 probable glutathione S-transferase [Selaginella moellendorffii]
MSKDSVKLLNFWPSMFGLRVHYALDLKGVSYDYQEERLLPNKSKELLEANPIYAKIPVLIHNGKPICESLIIVDYIDSVWPSPHKLLPEDPYEKAVARFWADFGDKKLFDAGSRLIRAMGEEHKKAGEDLKWALMKIDEALGTIAPGKPFFGGDAMNFADVALAPFICCFKAYQKVGGFVLPGPEEWPNLYKWVDAVNSVDAIKISTPSPDKVAEFAEVIRQRVIGTA